MLLSYSSIASLVQIPGPDDHVLAWVNTCRSTTAEVLRELAVVAAGGAEALHGDDGAGAAVPSLVDDAGGALAELFEPLVVLAPCVVEVVWVSGGLCARSWLFILLPWHGLTTRFRFGTPFQSC
jgi:hypothetical protein